MAVAMYKFEESGKHSNKKILIAFARISQWSRAVIIEFPEKVFLQILRNEWFAK